MRFYREAPLVKANLNFLSTTGRFVATGEGLDLTWQNWMDFNLIFLSKNQWVVGNPFKLLVTWISFRKFLIFLKRGNG